MNGVRLVVAFMESPDPLVKPAIKGRNVRGAKRCDPFPVNDCAADNANDLKQSETPYILSFAFNINLIPLATRDLRSPSMNSGDYTC
jgi:hypothetical protein